MSQPDPTENQRDRASALTVSAAHLLPLKRLAENAGQDFATLLARHGMPAAIDPCTDGHRIALADYYRLVQSLAVELQDETCRLSSRPLIPGSSHFIWSHVVGAENLFQAMLKVADAYNLLHGGRYNHVEMDSESLRYLIDDRAFPYVTSSQDEHVVFSLECVLIFLHCTLAMISSSRLHQMLRRVYTRRRRAGDGHHLRVLGLPIFRDRHHYGLVYRNEAAWLGVTANAHTLPPHGAVYDRIIEWIERGEPAGRAARPICDEVRELLESAPRSQRWVAGRLGISVATLRRRLADEGTNFRTLSAERSSGNACRLLRQGMRPAEVAEKLGYSDTRSFNRAFKNWRRITPAQFIRECGEAKAFTDFRGDPTGLSDDRNRKFSSSAGT